MNIDKEVFALWKDISPDSAFSAGLPEYAGTLWIPSHQNVKSALIRINALKKKADPVALKWLLSLERELLIEEPHDPPGAVMGVFFSHLIIEGVKEKHILELAEQCLSLLGSQEELCEREWPIEFQIFSAQSCDGAIALLATIKKQVKKHETLEAIIALEKRLLRWKKNTCKVKLPGSDFTKLFPLLKKHSKGLGRKNQYPRLLVDLYDYLESPDQIESLALGWIDAELPAFKELTAKLSKKYKCKPTVEDINKALAKHQKIPLKDLVKTTHALRKVLEPIADKEWVQITPKYDVRIIETPDYLTPFLPTAAMQPFNMLDEPFCISFVTTDPKASPSTFLPGVMQTLIHEEYGHCVNFMNSYRGFKGNLRLSEVLDSSLSTPITEGLSFHRELESLHTFGHIALNGPANADQKKLVALIEKFCPFSDFFDGLTFEVMQWRMVRFLRAISDVRLNLEKQTFPQFIAWAHKKTGLSEKLIFDQTFHFQENAGYAPCYSIFGQRLRELQKQVGRKDIPLVEFNTFVASRGFPARSILEAEIKKKFKL